MATETSATGRDSDKFMLRLPAGMRELIAEAARVTSRTMNAEVVARLQRTFAEDRELEQLKTLLVAQRSEILMLQGRLERAAVERAAAQDAAEVKGMLSEILALVREPQKREPTISREETGKALESAAVPDLGERRPVGETARPDAVVIPALDLPAGLKLGDNGAPEARPASRAERYPTLTSGGRKRRT